MKRAKSFAMGVMAAIVMLYAGPGNAAIVTFTAKADFLAAITTGTRTLDFEGLSAGDAIPSGTTVDGITFSYVIPGFTMAIDDTFSTTSGNNYLGLDGGEPFISGDSFSMTFANRTNALGLYVIAEPGSLSAGDIVMSAGLGTVFNSATPDLSLSDGDAYFLGIVETDPSKMFNVAFLASFDPGFGDFFNFNVDDITIVPLPASLVLLISGMLGLFAVTRGRQPMR
jgi:hypothetical protein